MRKRWSFVILALTSIQWLCLISCLIGMHSQAGRFIGIFIIPFIIISLFFVRPFDIIFSIIIILIALYLRKSNRINTIVLVIVVFLNIIACIFAQPVIKSYVDGIMSI